MNARWATTDARAPRASVMLDLLVTNPAAEMTTVGNLVTSPSTPVIQVTTMFDLDTIRLTQFAKRAGCAAKQPPDYLFSLLAGLPPIVDPNVIVGHATADDAAVYRLSDDLALILTTDFFTPIVDRPYDFGAVAAANALSDVYAMAGVPMAALSLVGFPSRSLAPRGPGGDSSRRHRQGERGGDRHRRRAHDPDRGADFRPRRRRASRPPGGHHQCGRSAGRRS